jgi:tRNA modification GTPase
MRQTANRPVIVVANKCDLVARDRQGFNPAHLGPEGRGDSAPEGGQAGPWVRASALTGDGMAELRAEILRHIGGDTGAQAEAGFLTSVRHLGQVQDSLAALDAATGAVATRIPHEMLLLDLYNALRPLDAVTGATTTDDILNLIFSTFCIGK